MEIDWLAMIVRWRNGRSERLGVYRTIDCIDGGEGRYRLGIHLYRILLRRDRHCCA